MKELKGTKTEQNLMKAFAGECQARTKYNYYQSQAKKDGYEQIAAVFGETSDNEKEHAKLWFKLLHGGNVPDTYTNLLDAAAGEKDEWTNMYKEMAETARSLKALLQSKRDTKKDIENLLNLLKQKPSSKRQKREYGFAETADISTWEIQHQKHAQYVLIQSHTLNYSKKSFNKIALHD